MFDKLFSFESPFMRAMTRIFDTTEMNILWLLCCVPVVTVGPATVAFYSAMITLIHDEETKIYKDFFRAFRLNFKKNFLTGLLLLFIGIFLGLDVYLSYSAGKGIYTFFMVFFSVMFLIWLMVALHTFPLLALAKQNDKVLKTLAFAFVIAIKHIFKTMLIIFLMAFILWLCHLAPVFIFFSFGLLVEFQSVLFDSILKSYTFSEQVNS